MMIKKILPFVFLLFLACEKEPDEFQFDYKISRSYTVDNMRCDSVVYYYNADNQLLRVDNFFVRDDVSEYYVEYKDDYILNCGSYYMFGSKGLITSIKGFGGITELKYDSGNIVYAKDTDNNFIKRESFYKYQNGNQINDSTVSYQIDSEPAITVYKYEYTDSLVKDFMVGLIGLYEFPKTSKNLVKREESVEQGILIKYSYEIMENELIQYADISVNNMNNQTMKTIYKLIHR